MKEQQPDELVKQGKKAYQNKKYLEAGEYFQAAAAKYAESDDLLSAAEAANNWSVAALQAGNLELSAKAAEGTPEIFLEAGDLRRAGMAYGNLATAQEKLNLLEDAYANYERSAELLKQAGDLDTRLHVMQALSALQLRTGKQLQALATMQAGLNGISKPNLKQKFLKKLLDVPNKYISGT
jgi:tetratricopeptide (TPR) repeat protein